MAGVLAVGGGGDRAVVGQGLQLVNVILPNGLVLHAGQAAAGQQGILGNGVADAVVGRAVRVPTLLIVDKVLSLSAGTKLEALFLGQLLDGGPSSVVVVVVLGGLVHALALVVGDHVDVALVQRDDISGGSSGVGDVGVVGQTHGVQGLLHLQLSLVIERESGVLGNLGLSGVSGGDLHLGGVSRQDLVANQVGPLVSQDHTGDVLQTEGLLTQGQGDGGVALVAVEGVVHVVVNHVDHDGLIQDLGHGLTVGIAAQGAGGDVLGDLAGLAHAGGLHAPVGAGEAAVGGVADRAQDHSQGGVALNLVVGVEVALAIALDVLGVGAEVDIAGEPGVRGHVLEQTVVRINLDLLILHIAGDDAVDDGGGFRTGDFSVGTEGTVFLVAVKDSKAGEDINGRLEAGIFLDVREVRGAGGSHEGQAHDEGQHHCENLLEISHGGFFLLLNFLERKVLIFAINRKSYVLFRQIGNYQAPY